MSSRTKSLTWTQDVLLLSQPVSRAGPALQVQFLGLCGHTLLSVQAGTWLGRLQISTRGLWLCRGTCTW